MTLTKMQRLLLVKSDSRERRLSTKAIPVYYCKADPDMFRVHDLHGDEVFVETQEPVVNAATTTSTIPVSAASATTTTVDELTLAQTLIEIKAAKPKVRGVMIQEPSETTTTTTTPAASKPSQDKGKAKMTESEKPLKKKDQIMYDQEVALNLQAQLQAELEEEERLTRQKEEEANIALIESWDNTQAMMDADRLLAERLQAREQEELTDEEKARLFVELLEKRKKHFAALRAQEKRNKPPTKAQKKSTMSTYLKHMAGYKQSQLKNKSFAEIQKLFDKAMTRVNMFVDMDTELVRESSKKDEAEMAQESSSKRAGDELEQEKAKKQKIDDDQEEAKLKELMEVISEEEAVAIDAIPLSTKPPSIVDYKIIKEGKISIYQIIRVDGSSKRYSAVIHMLKNFDREDLETLWKIVKARHGYTIPEEGYERVLWGDLKTMFEHHVEDLVWRYIQGNKVIVWKLFDSCGVHFVRFSNMHLFMLVEKRYPLTKATITEMLNKKLQADHWNEMCYQLLKLMTKIKRLHDDRRVTAAQLVLLVQSYNCLFRVNAAGTKLQLLKDYNCSRIKTVEKIKIDWRSRILT
ncbi:hypothetical protein Tco_0647481 [Tanacetum coccineum]